MGYNIIRRLFGKHKSEEDKKEPEEQQPVFILLSITEEGQLDVKCEWQKEDDATVLLLSELLFYLSSGFVSPYIENILLKHMSDNPESELFITAALMACKEMAENTFGAEDSPLIKPSQVFREG